MVSAMSEARVKLYTTRACSYCVAAKRLLQQDDIAFQEIDLTTQHELRAQLSREHHWRTVPMIFIDDEFVGGFQELARRRSEGGLKDLQPSSQG